ncbi:uncharacterized protein BXZ73DRAFT_79454 [Epithele typhae]|uniref:uncharacterized protein n=1 Tax=Epithele typhae TaxID=378194 RepID=UPI00200724CB|nr:uncharacterized protein BXZ73DRAFT_79454 [Epithele typhae]KAH9923770.1 hypothetical protein BXZ73DRAFT_79454 [Epithele typhae]
MPILASQTPQLAHLCKTLEEQPSICSGTLALPSDQLEMYYGRKNSRIGKMNVGEFMMGFDVEKLGSWTQSPPISEATPTTRSVQSCTSSACIARDNSSKRTQTPLMLPTCSAPWSLSSPPRMMAGHSLLLREDEQEFVFDSAKLLAGRNDCIAYIAFFSDVEHEVTPLLSGHRVTVAYNLFDDAPGDRSTLQPWALVPRASASASAEAVALALGAMIDDLPRVWDANAGVPDVLQRLMGWLKGADRARFRAAKALGLEPSLRIVLSGCWIERRVVMSTLPGFWRVDEYANDDLEMELQERGGEVLQSRYFPEPYQEPGEVTMHWVRPLPSGAGHQSREHATKATYTVYGNEASLSYMYASFCVLVKIGASGVDAARRRAAE